MVSLSWIKFLFVASLTEHRSHKDKHPILYGYLLSPTTGKAFIYGWLAISAAFGLGIGILTYYVLDIHPESAFAHSYVWPGHVYQRLCTTYVYLATTLSITVTVGYMAARNTAILSLMSVPNFLDWFRSLIVIAITGRVVRYIDYTTSPMLKHMVWIAHSCVIGTNLAPLCYMEIPALLKAAWCTAIFVGGLTTIAIFTPSREFQRMIEPLNGEVALVFVVSSLGTFFFPSDTSIGAVLASIAIYGGLILFSIFLIRDTQSVINLAEGHPDNNANDESHQYDPINSQISLYMNILDIFIRMAIIMVGEEHHK